LQICEIKKVICQIFEYEESVKKNIILVLQFKINEGL